MIINQENLKTRKLKDKLNSKINIKEWEIIFRFKNCDIKCFRGILVI